MPLSPEQAAAAMAADIETNNPALARALGKFTADGIGFAIIGSSHAEWSARQCGMELPKAPDDVDIQVVEFDRAVEALMATQTSGVTVRLIEVNGTTGDGLPIHFIAREATADLDGKTLQFMDVAGGSIQVGDSYIRTGITEEDLHASAPMRHGWLAFAHPSLAMEIYALRQATAAQGKHDLERATAIRAAQLLNFGAAEPDLYPAFRAHEAGWDSRMRNFDTFVTFSATTIISGIAAARAARNATTPL